MRRITQQTFGSPEVLELETDAPLPDVAPGEVLVEVKAAGVNPVDAKVRAGGALLGDPPFTVGWDVSGTVVEGDYHGFEPGDEVFGLIRFPEQAAAYAEYVSAPAGHLLKKPPTITHEEAAAIPLVFETAWQALVERAQITEGDRVLIHAGAGGVGHVAIQIAKSKGAYVITTASAAKHEFLKALGADETIDYREIDFAEAVENIDVVFDTVGAGTARKSLPTLKDGGTIVTIVEYADEQLGDEIRAQGFEYHGFRVVPNSAHLAEAVKMIEQRKLHIELAAVLSMEAAAKAHELLETGRTTGKIVLIP